ERPPQSAAASGSPRPTRTQSSPPLSTSFHRRHHQTTSETTPRLRPGRFFFRMSEPRSLVARELAIAIHTAAVQGVDPRSATRSAVSARLTSAEPPVWIIALGKAAGAMAEAAVQVLREHHQDPAGGAIVAPDNVPSPHSR